PRPPCGGRRFLLCCSVIMRTFQPTPSLRRATKSSPAWCWASYNFNPRPPCGGRRVPVQSVRRYRQISTHALLAEGDGLIRAWRRAQTISTHALLAEGDMRADDDGFVNSPNFNPRPPCG